MRFLWRFLIDEDGPTAVEYAVLLGGILVACIAAITTVGGEAVDFWETNQKTLDKTLDDAKN